MSNQPVTKGPHLFILGSGGGAGPNFFRKTRMAAGFRINGELNVQVDPGPLAFCAMARFNQPPKLDAIIVTHKHDDHCSNAGPLIGATAMGRNEEVTLIGSKSVIGGDENGDRGVSVYHQKKAGRVIVATPGDVVAIGSGIKTAALAAIATVHQDKTCFGFVYKSEGFSLGYTSDTEYRPEIAARYRGGDVLLMCVYKDSGRGLSGHLHTKTAIQFAADASPKLAVLTHIGVSMENAGPKKQAELVEKETGVRTVAAEDGMIIGLATLQIFQLIGKELVPY